MVKKKPWPTRDRASVWPKPRTAVLGDGSAALDPHAAADLFILVSGCCAPLLHAAFERYRRYIFWTADALPHLRMRATGLRDSASPPELCDASSAPSFGTLRVRIGNGTATPLQLGVDESYTLALHAGGGELRAASEWGALRGLETFAQLVQWDGRAHVLCGLPLTIDDAPEHAWRGLLLDSSRHFLPVPTIVRMLDGMAALKLNTLHWHLSDAQSFPIASAAAPALAESGAWHPSLVYAPDDLRAVVEAARLRGVRVVPELDMPGHSASWGLGEPELVVPCPKRVAIDDMGVEHGVDKVALHPLRERTYEVVASLLTELAAVFPDEYIHLGGDEIDAECWLHDSEVNGWAREAASNGADWKAALQGAFTRRVLALLPPLGKRAVLWDEALETGLPPGAVTIDVWRDWMKEPTERHARAAAAGFDVVWSCLGWYLDLPGNTWQSIYETRMPSSGLLGGEASSWGEHADATNLEQRVLTRAAAAAERLWSGRPSATAIARQRLASLRCRLLRRGLQAAPVIPDHCGLGGNATEEASLVAALVASAEAHTAFSARLGDCPRCAPPPPPPPGPAGGALLLGASLGLNALLLLLLAARWLLGRKEKRE